MKIVRSIYYRCLIVYLAWQWINQNNLGDTVIHAGKQWILSQGVSAPTWTLRRENEAAEVHERDFTKVRTPATLWRSFRSGYRFYMQSWFDIWVREGIQPWMRGLSIWPRKRV